MVNRSRNVKKMGGRNSVTNVRVIDQLAGSDGAYIDRCISDLQNSHSQITVLIQDSYVLNSGTSAVNATYAGPQVAVTDDFGSFSAQFETFRIRAIRFDIYDINPSNPAVGWFSTFHDQFTAGAQPSFVAGSVIDGPDSSIVPPGTGKISLYWRAHGTLENQFVTDTTQSGAVASQYFGGLRASIAAASSAAKFQIVIKALVDFRGRD